MYTTVFPGYAFPIDSLVIPSTPVNLVSTFKSVAISLDAVSIFDVTVKLAPLILSLDPSSLTIVLNFSRVNPTLLSFLIVIIISLESSSTVTSNPSLFFSSIVNSESRLPFGLSLKSVAILTCPVTFCEPFSYPYANPV